MVSEKIIVDSPLGIHLRPAGAICDAAQKFKCEVTIQCGEMKTANAKSVLSLLAAGVKCGNEIIVKCEGSDEEDALQAVVNALKESLKD